MGVEDYLGEVTSREPICQSGSPGTFTWTPDFDTPNEVYYQVANIILIAILLPYRVANVFCNGVV